MKKIYPVIIFLVTGSLIGIIYVQYSWFQNMLLVKDEQLNDRITKSVAAVGKEVSNPGGSLPILRRQRKSQLSLGDDLPTELLQRTLIGDRFTQFEIREKLENTFKQYQAPVSNFEFAVTNNSSFMAYEMQSPGFATEVADTINNRTFNLVIEPASGTWNEGLAPMENLIVVVPEFKKLVRQQSYWELIGAIVFTLFIMFAFFLTLRTMFNQKKLSEIKSDFINNMTHEFKTPLATISLAVDALNNGKVIQDADKTQYFRGIIKEENRRMNKHVETILQAAALERQEFTLDKKPLHVHDLVNNVLENFELVLKEKNGKVKLNLNAKNDTINADEQHFTNLLSNLVDNAIKYSKEEPDITITTYSTGKHLVMRISDKGIGMSRESVKRVFEKFYRAHTGNLHNVKGFGLGMSYVKTIIDAHKGRIKVESILGKGSTFIVEVPLATLKETVS